MKKKYTLAKLLILITFFLFNSIQAQSYYSSKEFGVQSYFPNSQAIGIGGTFIAVVDGFQINTLNPAGLVSIPVTRLSGDFIHEAIWNKSKNETGFSKYTNLNGISLAIPFKAGKLVSAFCINPTSQFDYEYENTGQIDDYNYSKKIIAQGGLNKISVGIGFSPIRRVSFGAAFNYYFGKLEQTWQVDYVSDLFWDTSNKLTRKMWGFNFSTGMIVNPIPPLFLGAFYSSNYKLNSQDHIKNSTTKGSMLYTVSKYDYDQIELTMPESWGIGLSYIIKKKYRVACDYMTEQWSDFKINDITAEDYQNRHRIGVGLEMLPSVNMLAKYYEKMTFRVGYFYQGLDLLDINGNSISEYGVTLGFGFPYYGTLGRIDVALKYGVRGDLSKNPVEENIFQLFISITGGEKWFVRRDQR